METKVLDQKNIADVVGQSEKEEISHFRVSPLYSKVHRLYGGLSIGLFSKVEEDAKYSLNAGFLAGITNSQKSVNIGIFMGGGELSEYSLCISGILGGFKELKKSVNIGGLISCGDDVTSSINTGLFADIGDHTKKSLNFGVVCARTVYLESSVNAGGIASLVEGDAKNSAVAGLYNKTRRLTNSLEIGVVNVTQENLGWQIGIVNICGNRIGAIEKKETKGKSIGLVNIDLDKKWYESVSLFYR